MPTRLGRGGENAIRLDGDDFVSTRHALLEPRPDGLWVEDVGSTNGTFVNGARVTTARLLTPGDVVRIGQTDLQGRGMRTGRASALTDTGRRRPHNEDTFVCDPPLFAVADGVGGAQAGEIASRLAAAALEERLPGALGEETLAELLQTANDRIYRHALDDPAAAGMGTVVTALLVDEDAGDDRDRPRRRLPRLPAAGRRARAADPRSLARRRARPLGAAVDRGGRAASAPIGDHAGRRHRADRRRRDADAWPRRPATST